ncbi:YceI family protein [Comamonas sp. lk]|uniref:YceI family protein n=1 Tax=Comamonas sp. lk TaxID=2201272 RepID=UPI000EB52922|nr:YceI family protein [Comamonas sp. lk]
MRKTAFCLAGLLAAIGLTQAQAAEWKMDTAKDNRLEFIASFENRPAPGVFKDFDVRLRFDPEQAGAEQAGAEQAGAGQPSPGQLDVSVRVTSADMANADINQAIAGLEWFDFARHQQARFHASDIRRVQAGRYLARGTLTLKGVQKPVELPFTWSAASGAATMEGELIVKRAAFGIGTGEWAATDVIAADVKVKFRIQLREAS